jgi:hypothetical protein
VPADPGQCGGVPPARAASVVDMGGTSMASPVAAGGAALVREYFLQGYYPTGRPAAGDGFAPSGALLRAVLVTATSRLTGSVGSAPLDARIPNNQQGFGSLTLVRGLVLDPPAPDGPPALFLRDEGGRWGAACADTGTHWAWGLEVRGPGPWGLKASLSWTDPPGSLSGDVVLVNDLDLALVGPDGRHWLGNNFSFAGDEGAYSMPDRANNHEQVRPRPPPARGVEGVSATRACVCAWREACVWHEGRTCRMARRVYVSVWRKERHRVA